MGNTGRLTCLRKDTGPKSRNQLGKKDSPEEGKFERVSIKKKKKRYAWDQAEDKRYRLTQPVSGQWPLEEEHQKAEKRN